MKNAIWVIIGVVLLTALGLSQRNISNLEKEILSYQVTIANMKTEYANERELASKHLVEAQERIREVHQELNTKSSEYRKELTDAKTNSDRKYADISRRLLNAEARNRALSDSLYGLSESSSTSSNPTATLRSDELLLLRKIGQEDVDEARRADQMRENLEYCYKEYNLMRESIEKFNNSLTK